MSPDSTDGAPIKARLAEIFSKTVDVIGYVPDDLAEFAHGRAAHRTPPAESGAETPPAPPAGDHPASPVEALAKRVVAYYDHTWFAPNPLGIEFLGDQGIRNMGYWPPNTRDQNQASERLQDYLLGYIPEKKGRILDVGCGLGGATRRLFAHYAPEKVWAINISEKQIEATRARAPGCHAQVMNAVEMTFDDAFFDAIISIEAAFHFETRRQFFEGALRVLKPGGRLVLSDILFTSAARHAQFPHLLGGPANHVESIAAYQALLEEVGFRNVVVEDLRDMIWRPHLLRFLGMAHEYFLDRKIGMLELADYLALYYELDTISGPWLAACAEK